jgi:hypothetical protein
MTARSQWQFDSYFQQIMSENMTVGSVYMNAGPALHADGMQGDSIFAGGNAKPYPFVIGSKPKKKSKKKSKKNSKCNKSGSIIRRSKIAM